MYKSDPFHVQELLLDGQNELYIFLFSYENLKCLTSYFFFANCEFGVGISTINLVLMV